MSKTSISREARDRPDGPENGSETWAKRRRTTAKKQAERERQMIADAAYGFLSERIARLRLGEGASRKAPAPTAAPAPLGRGKKHLAAQPPPAKALRND